jgi:hypothetical protein
MEESLIAAFNNIGRMEAQPVNDLISVLGQVGGEPVHELLWSFVDRGGAGGRGLDQALNAIAWQKDPKDLPRLADYLIAVQADDRSGNSFAVVPNVLRAQFGDAATPALRDVMEKAQSQAIRLRSAEELLYARARAGFAFALDAMQQNRPWKAQIARFVTDQFPEARGSDAAMLQFLTDRSKESAAR